VTSKTFKVIFLWHTMIKNKTSAKSLSHLRFVRGPFFKKWHFSRHWGSIGHKFQTSRKSWKKCPKRTGILARSGGPFWAFLRLFGPFWETAEKGQKSAKMAKNGTCQITQKCPKIVIFRPKTGFFWPKKRSVLTVVDDKPPLKPRPSPLFFWRVLKGVDR